MPRRLVLPRAKQAEVAKLCQALLEERGALLDERTPDHTVFEGLAAPGRFRRGGYVGTYQAVGEHSVEVELEVWAPAARRFFWGTVALEAGIVVVLFALSPPSAAWFAAGLALWPWLGLAALLYGMTLRGSDALEAELCSALEARLRGAGLEVLGEEAQLERRIRERLEAEQRERELAARRAAEPEPAKPPRKRPLAGFRRKAGAGRTEPNR